MTADPAAVGHLPSCTSAPGGGAAIRVILTDLCEEDVILPAAHVFKHDGERG